MQLARVIGNVVSTAKDPGLAGCTLLVLQPLSAAREKVGAPLVAVDSVGAGAGEDVFFVRGREAAFPFHPRVVPTDASVTGICDHWSTEAVATTPSRRASRRRSTGG
ncbi:MAG: ethanolamine utilization protein EutN [Acidobacteria bacterium]|jgi:microcompartment protein CcmK/EutM|nr:ethanolamine utilization protein EutN [Acidobacteriota bacterium]MBQ01622.1 ethanolamine utilization protein EutN [Acidobacteriota bacterium]MDP7480739.1 EutN/CcmL family microcompartment protein [Vicinamibacterales bacterium]MDP7690580.1 EutN/CcmL family microcompartment protein [Vicinamibacterales bacterium]HJN45619.1 EutN/CcmL family microcompartment protein [Vicinamibacterales bacterium]|tara:strand:- start:138 stop:458 length:321 start_codon:yes stop_codon:yes gene_type:complete